MLKQNIGYIQSPFSAEHILTFFSFFLFSFVSVFFFPFGKVTLIINFYSHGYFLTIPCLCCVWLWNPSSSFFFTNAVGSGAGEQSLVSKAKVLKGAKGKVGSQRTRLFSSQKVMEQFNNYYPSTLATSINTRLLNYYFFY